MSTNPFERPPTSSSPVVCRSSEDCFANCGGGSHEPCRSTPHQSMKVSDNGKAQVSHSPVHETFASEGEGIRKGEEFSIGNPDSRGRCSSLYTPCTSHSYLLPSGDVSSPDSFLMPHAPYPSLQSARELNDWLGTQSNPLESPEVSLSTISHGLFDSFQASLVNSSISRGHPSEVWSPTPHQPTKEHDNGGMQFLQYGNEPPVAEPLVQVMKGPRKQQALGSDKWKSPDFAGNTPKSTHNEHGFLSDNADSRNVLSEAAAAVPEQRGRKAMRTERFSPPPRKPEVENGQEPSATKLATTDDIMGAGEGKGAFRAPRRGVLYVERPVSLELRPQPLKEMQTNQVTRVLACTNEAVWAACDYGIMVWDIESACNSSCDGRDNIIGDEDAAAFSMLPVHGSITTSLVPDIANSTVWSGHKDGKVRAWPMHVRHGHERSEGINSAIFIWQAHRAPVLSMVITSYGELWTGSENGSIRAWPCEATMRALSSPVDEAQTVASYIAHSYIDLRSRGTAAGAVTLPNADVQFLIAEHSTRRVWSAGSYLLALWDAQTRDILKVFGPNAQADFSSSDISPLCENTLEDEMKATSARVSKKKRIQGGLNFLQRSRNAVLGAADAVLRAAVGGQSLDESKKVEALVAAADGTVWTGHASGLLVKWDSHGNLLHEQHYDSVTVKCMCTFGARVWVGYADGRVQVLDLWSGKLLGRWHAHQSAVAQMKTGGGHVFTLAYHGGIQGWNFASPSPLDDILQLEMCAREPFYTRHKQLKILAGCWNVGQERASFESLKLWLHDKASQASIVVIGLQEMEMGAGVLAMAAAKETVGLEGSANGQWWLENIANALGGGKSFERIASRQLAGLLIAAWAKKNIVPYVGEVDVGAVACGFGRAFGNKGAVAIKMMIFRRTICVVNCHFAAHADAVARRNTDFEHVYQRMAFGRSFGGVGVAATAMAAGVSSAVQMIRGANVRKTGDAHDTYLDKELSTDDSNTEADSTIPELSEVDMLIWVGDFNYRIDEVSYEDAVTLISHKLWEVLLKKDQLRTEMKGGRVFQGMREGLISFPPTYKFDKGRNGLGLHPAGYDSSEKRRVPAWCDRILFRDSFDRSDSEQEVSLSHPIRASPIWYEACMDVMESDHKPVSCMFHTELAVVDEAARRQEYGKLIHTNSEVQRHLTETNYIPETVVNTNFLCVEDCNRSFLNLTNECGQTWAFFDIYCEGQPTGSTCPCKQSHELTKNQLLRGSYGFPFWLQVVPAAGVLGPGQTVEIAFWHAGEPLMEDNNHKGEKVVVIVVNIKGNLSSASWQHRICVTYKATKIFHQHEDVIDHNERKFLNRSSGLVSELDPCDT